MNDDDAKTTLPKPAADDADRGTEVEVDRVVRAAEEAAKAAFEESFERADALFRWTRSREEAKEAATERPEQKETAALADEDPGAIELVAKILELAPALTEESRFVPRGLPPSASAADRAFLEALADGATFAEAKGAVGLDDGRARALALIGLATGSLAKKLAEVDVGAWVRAHRDRDYFAILGVDADASPEAAQAAYQARCAALGLSGSGEPRSPDAKEALQMLDEARTVITSPVIRSAYRCHHSGGS